MKMNPDLEILRTTATAIRDLHRQPGWEKSYAPWERYRQNVKERAQAARRLFLQVGPQASKEICLAMLEDYLPNLQKLHPANRSYADALRRIRRSLEDPNRPFRHRRVRWFRTPGTSTFAHVIFELSDALEEEPLPDSYLGYSWMAETTIGAWGDFVWGTRNPAAYQRLMALESPRCKTVNLKEYDSLRIQPIVYPPSIEIAYEKRMWLADLLEAALPAGGREPA